MSSVNDAIEDFVDAAIDEVATFLEDVWDDVVEPILEPIFGFIGIDDELVAESYRVSVPIFQNMADEDMEQAAITRAVLAKIKTDGDFFPFYMEQIYTVKAQFKSMFDYANTTYIDELPNYTFSGHGPTNFIPVRAMIETEIGSTVELISITTRHPRPTEWFQYYLQTASWLSTPTEYKLWTNSLTSPDPWGVVWDDWQLIDATYNAPGFNYHVNIERSAQEAKFWIEGPKQVTEGDAVTFILKSNREIPVGKTMTGNLVIGGTAVFDVDYDSQGGANSLIPYTMPAGATEHEITVQTKETGNANRTMDVSFTVNNTGGVFEAVTIHTPSSVLTTITDDDSLKLTVNDVLVDEANTTISLFVVCEQAATGAFSVDYDFTDLGTIIGGTDYDNTPGTLNFTGAAGNTQQIDIDIYADVANDDKEQFEVYFNNLVGVTGVDISDVSTVTIFDGTLDPAAGNIQLQYTQTYANYGPSTSTLVLYTDNADPPGQQKSFIYVWGGSYPDVEQDVSRIGNMEMLPSIAIRKNKVTINDASYSTRYQQTKQILSRLNLDVDHLIENIENNPDIDDVDDCYINFSVSPNDTHKVLSKIMYLQWFLIIETYGLTSSSSEYSNTFREGDHNFSAVWKTNVYNPGLTGVKAAVGEYAHERKLTSNLHMYYQIDASTYDELVVTKLNGTTIIRHDTGETNENFHNVAFCRLGDDEFTIPISWFVWRDLTPSEQMVAYRYIFRMDIQATVLTVIPWYETTAFYDFIELISIFISIATFDWSGTWYQIAAELIKQYAINYAIGELIYWVAEQTGNEELAAFAGVVAAVYLNDTSGVDWGQLMQAETLTVLSTAFVNNLLLVQNAQALEELEELQETAAQNQKRLDEKENQRPDVEGVSDQSDFVAYLQSANTVLYPAIIGQYDYDQLFSYDSIINTYHDKQLRLGVYDIPTVY